MAAGDAALATFFASRKGLAIVSRSGRSGDVKLLGTDTAQGAFLMHLDDKLAGDYWRAILGLRGRLVTVTAVGTGKVRLTPEASRRVVEKTLRVLRNVNPVVEAIGEATAGATAGAAAVATAGAAGGTPNVATAGATEVPPKGGLAVSPVPPPRPAQRSAAPPSGLKISPVPPLRPGESVASSIFAPAKIVPLEIVSPAAVPPGIVPPPRPGR